MGGGSRVKNPVTEKKYLGRRKGRKKRNPLHVVSNQEGITFFLGPIIKVFPLQKAFDKKDTQRKSQNNPTVYD